jgi:hypothetical protein
MGLRPLGVGRSGGRGAMEEFAELRWLSMQSGTHELTPQSPCPTTHPFDQTWVHEVRGHAARRVHCGRRRIRRLGVRVAPGALLESLVVGGDITCPVLVEGFEEGDLSELFALFEASLG